MLQVHADADALRRSNINEEPVSDDEAAVLIDVAADAAAASSTTPPVKATPRSFATQLLSLAPRAILLPTTRSSNSGNNNNNNNRGTTTSGSNSSTRSTATPSKVLFLDGVRGLAGLFVVTEHSLYWNGKNLGACAVDTFFVLSSFLLTMLFYKKSEQLIVQQATYRQWVFTLIDYFSKRFFRVYPLFALVAVFVWLLPFEAQQRYFFVPNADSYDLWQVLTFDLDHRFHVFWTLPLEIAYYFLIPLFVFGIIGLKRAWWLPFVPLTIWIVNAGLKGYREHHLPLAPHLPTFVVGSMGAVVYCKLERQIATHKFTFPRWLSVLLRVVESVVVAHLLSVTFKGLLFHWIYPNPAPTTRGSQCVSMHVTFLIVLELLLPSPLATAFEWNVLRYWGKLSFSSYLLHSFVIYAPWIQSQRDPYDKFFASFGLIAVLAQTSYALVEYPSQLLSGRISRLLSAYGGLAAPARGSYLPVALTVPKARRSELLEAAGAHKDDDDAQTASYGIDSENEHDGDDDVNGSRSTRSRSRTRSADASSATRFGK